MRALLALALCLWPIAAGGQSLRGQWTIEIPSKPEYMATFLVDAERRATWDSAYGKMVGYVARADNLRATIIITNRDEVAHMQCAIKSSDLMYCHNFLADGGISALLKLVRVGPGPKNLTQAPQ